MAKDKSSGSGALMRELFFEAGLYKRSQGRITRQVTFAAIAITIALGSYELWKYLQVAESQSLRYAIPGVILVVGLWLAYRVVNLPRFADFLISVEAEMNKVSWPSRGELIRSSVVVVFVIFFLAGLLFTYDIIWQALFKAIGVIRDSK